MEKGGSEMKRLAGIRVIGMLAALAAVLALIQGLGGYLVSELTQFETTAPEVGSPAETQTPAVIHRQTLRLETMAYNTLQIGTFTDLAKGQHIIDELAEDGLSRLCHAQRTVSFVGRLFRCTRRNAKYS